MTEAAPSEPKKRLVVGITGASGSIYGVRMLQVLRRLDVESHLVVSRSGQVTLGTELDLDVGELRELADFSYSINDIGAAPSSGSFQSLGMVVAPCSVRSMSEIATGVTGNLLTRAADVTLKERRRLVLMFRETPLHAGHIRTMSQATESGAIIAPPVPAFYTRPQTLDDIIDHSVGRVLDLFGLDTGRVKRWGEPGGSGSVPRRSSEAG